MKAATLRELYDQEYRRRIHDTSKCARRPHELIDLDVLIAVIAPYLPDDPNRLCRGRSHIGTVRDAYIAMGGELEGFFGEDTKLSCRSGVGLIAGDALKQENPLVTFIRFENLVLEVDYNPLHGAGGLLNPSALDFE